MAAGWNMQMPMEKHTANNENQKKPPTDRLHPANQIQSKTPLHSHSDASKKKRWTRTNGFQNVEKPEHLCIAGQMQNSAATAENGSESDK